MAEYTIEKTSRGYVIRVEGQAVLTMRARRQAEAVVLAATKAEPAAKAQSFRPVRFSGTPLLHVPSLRQMTDAEAASATSG